MTDRRADEGFAVVPQRIGGGRSGGPGRGRQAKAAIALAIAAGIVGIAVFGPRLSGRPNFDIAFFATPTPNSTPTPTATIRPVLDGATPLPDITRSDGGALTGAIAVWADGVRILDLGAGTSLPVLQTDFGRDLVVRAPEGVGWWCVCMQDVGGGPDLGMTRDIGIDRFSSEGVDGSFSRVASLGDPDPAKSLFIQSDIELAPDRRSGLIVVGRLTTTSVEYSMARIDLVGATIGPWTALGRLEIPPFPTPSGAPSPNPENSSNNPGGPFIRRSPDGTFAVVWSQFQQYSNDQVTFQRSLGWSVPLDKAGNPGPPEAAPSLATLPDVCPWIGFIGPGRLVSICAQLPGDPAPPDGAPAWQLIEIGSDGRIGRHIKVPSTEQYFTDPLFDVANGVVWLWDPIGLTIVRVDTKERTAATKKFDPLLERVPGGPELPGVQPVWSRPMSSLTMWSQPQITGAPDGSALYALGYSLDQPPDAQGQPSLGVFVIDPKTLAVVDRWDPAANYVAIEPVLGGRAVAVTGQPGVDAGGRAAPWSASLTFYDPADGRILLRFGQLGEGFPPAVIRP